MVVNFELSDPVFETLNHVNVSAENHLVIIFLPIMRITLHIAVSFILKHLFVVPCKCTRHSLRLDVIVDKLIPLNRQLFCELLSRVFKLIELLLPPLVISTL